jgi:hypothetical protein
MGRNAPVPGKHPWGGSKNVIRSGEELLKGLKKVTNPNLGLPTGRETGITVLDFDGAEGLALFEQWQADGLILPDMLTASNWRAAGFTLSLNTSRAYRRRCEPCRGLDIRNEGGADCHGPFPSPIRQFV